MNNIEDLEKKLNSHILFIYQNDSKAIDITILKEIYKHTKKMNDYDSINIVLHTKGGNLGVGTRIMYMLREKYNKVNCTIMELCASTGSLMALSSDNLFITPYTHITTAEPKIDIYDDKDTSVSVAIIRNLIDYNKDSNLDPIVFANYLATINYYKDLCYKINDKDKANKIINYMLTRINSHQYPLDINELNEMVNTEYLDKDIEKELEIVHDEIMDKLNSSTSKNKKLSIILSKNLMSIEEKIYNDSKEKVKEGFTTIERKEDNMNNNKRIKAILNENTKAQKSYCDGYIDNEYDDSKYYDNYTDLEYADSKYRDAYEDSYHDSYHDSYEDSYNDTYLDGFCGEKQVKKAKVKSLKKK